MRSTSALARSLAAIIVCILSLGLCDQAAAWEEGSFIRSGNSEPESSGPDDGLKPFDEVVKDCVKSEGLFTFWRDRDRGKLYMEIRKDQMEHPYIMALTREAAEGVFFDNGAMLDESIFVLRREGKKVQWLKPNILFRAKDDSAFARAILRGVSASLVAALDMASKPQPETGTLLVDPGAFFLQDHGFVQASLKETQAGYALDREGSYVDAIRTFPRNAEVSVVLNFRTENPTVPMPYLPDPRSFQHTYRWSLIERPAEGYIPRLADDRVGHFLTMLQDYSNTRTESAYVRYINRWRLEKANPAAALSEPKEPIVYWLENTIPQEYREPLRRGILNWNRAFEAAGIKNAILVREMPDTASWDPADVRYHVVRWILQPGAAYAVGPSRTDPLTGEIFDADIRVCADLARWVYREWNDQISPLGEGWETAAGRGGCTLAEGKAAEAAFGISMAMARGLFDPESPEGRRYLDEYVEGLICHEVGHTLGLRHNFKSSVINDLAQLQDTARTRDLGITGSIMDYTPVNLARAGEKQGQYWQVGPGAYDLWAIEYAYRPFGAPKPEDELPDLDRIASRSTEPLLAYATDEDTRGNWVTACDPTATLWDLSSDPIGWCEVRLDQADELWSRMDEFLSKPGMRYPRYRSVFRQGLGEYYTAASTIPRYIGGVYHRRDHVGDPDGRPPFEPVSAAKQREALRMLRERIFAEDALDIPAELLNKMAPERMPTFDAGLWSSMRIDPAIHGMILSVQTGPLDRLYHPVTLSRIQDSELRFAPGEQPFTMIEMFTGLREAIWSEIRGGRPVNSVRRGLQRAHLNHLIKFVIAPELGTPEDATTCARADLKWIAAGCKTALAGQGLDSMTRAHLDETKDRIAMALDAPIQRAMPDPAAGPQM